MQRFVFAFVPRRLVTNGLLLGNVAVELRWDGLRRREFSASGLSAIAGVFASDAVVRRITPSAPIHLAASRKNGLLRRFAPLRKRFAFVAGNDDLVRFNPHAKSCHTRPAAARLALRLTPLVRRRDCKYRSDDHENDRCRHNGNGRAGEVGEQAQPRWPQNIACVRRHPVRAHR